MAFTTVGILAHEDNVAPEDFISEARRRLDVVLDSSRLIDNDPARVASLEDIGDAPSYAPTPHDMLEVEELRAVMLARPDLSPAERRVLAARIELGQGATGEEIAAAAGVPVASERVRTHRLREKLSDLR